MLEPLWFRPARFLSRRQATYGLAVPVIEAPTDKSCAVTQLAAHDPPKHRGIEHEANAGDLAVAQTEELRRPDGAGRRVRYAVIQQRGGVVRVELLKQIHTREHLRESR